MSKKALDSITDSLYRVKRGLAGYVSYLAACEMNEAFSEYVLYEPILRILSARGFEVKSEVECPGYPCSGRGDAKRLDFVAQDSNAHFALEVKWAKNRKPRVNGDLEKLWRYRGEHGDAQVFLCVFGRKSVLSVLLLPEGFKEKGNPVYAEFGRTRYGCRMFGVKNG